jgi:hypothetical protein
MAMLKRIETTMINPHLVFRGIEKPLLTFARRGISINNIQLAISYVSKKPPERLHRVAFAISAGTERLAADMIEIPAATPVTAPRRGISSKFEG